MMDHTFFFFFPMHRLLLGKYMALKGLTAKTKLKASLLISVPWDVFAATKNTEENYFNLILNKYLASNLRLFIHKYHISDIGPFDMIDIDTVLKVHYHKCTNSFLFDADLAIKLIYFRLHIHNKMLNTYT